MSQEWMIDVLTDLRKFARNNGLMGLAEQLDDTILIAATEMKSQRKTSETVFSDANPDRSVHRAFAAIENI